jgi:hypothetical protein
MRSDCANSLADERASATVPSKAERLLAATVFNIIENFEMNPQDKHKSNYLTYVYHMASEICYKPSISKACREIPRNLYEICHRAWRRMQIFARGVECSV